MSTERVSVDTNILVYFLDQDAGIRHESAIKFIENLASSQLDCILTLQSLCEFCSVVIRKNKSSLQEALQQVRDWQTLFPIITLQPGTLIRAIQAVEKHQLPFWDAMLWSTVKDAGVSILFSEDFQNGRIIEGVKIVNPFQHGNILENL